VIGMVAAPSPGSSSVEDRTARLVLSRPERWTRDVPSGTDLRVSGDGITVTVRSRPSDNAIDDECRALLDRLPGSVDGVLVVGCDPWTTAGAPARLVEYSRPGVDQGADPVFVSHLLAITGRHRIEVVAERPVPALAATDDLVFAVLDAVRVTDPVRGTDTTFGALPEIPTPSISVGTHIDAEGLATLQALAGRRWNPATLRTAGGKALVDAGLLGRFGTMPATTGALLAPWAALAEPATLEQRADDGTRTRLQSWQTSGAPGVSDGAEPRPTVTVVDGDDEHGYEVGVLAATDLLTLVAERVGLAPSWTWPFRVEQLPEHLLGRRIDEGPDAVPLPDAIDDDVLRRFWAAPWTVSRFRRAGRPAASMFVRAHGVGLARVGRTVAGSTPFRAEAPANAYRSFARALL
jgi:hypothetical protein